MPVPQAHVDRSAERPTDRVGLAPLGNLLRKRLPPPVSDDDDEYYVPSSYGTSIYGIASYMSSSASSLPVEPSSKLRRPSSQLDIDKAFELGDELGLAEGLLPPISVRAAVVPVRGGGRVRLTLLLVGAAKLRARKKKPPNFLTVRSRAASSCHLFPCAPPAYSLLPPDRHSRSHRLPPARR